MRPQLGGPGKAMIVCVSREVCVKVYDALAELRPGWAYEAVDKGKMKIVFHGDPSDLKHLRKHALRPSQHRTVQARANDPDDELELLIVHSMLLTGFDAPPIHTLYMDRPMQGANLMQALARVNRRFLGKQDGLLVGYAAHRESAKGPRRVHPERPAGPDQTLGRDVDRALTEVRNEHNTICGLLAGIDWRALLADTSKPQSRRRVLQLVSNHLRDPRTPGNQVEPGTATLAARFRESATRLERFHRLCAMNREIAKRSTTWRPGVVTSPSSSR